MTEEDRKNIARLIDFYEHAFPGEIKRQTDTSRKEVLPYLHQRTMATDPHAFERRMTIPSGLWRAIKEGYPAIESDRVQFEQFLKWFPIFDLRRK